jgi:membrane protease YdiL (CAAX protease family)
MSILWSYFWPCFAVGLLVGGLIGTIAFRRRSRRNGALAAGIFVSLFLAGLWHGPLGAADRFTAGVEHDARAVLDHYEMTQVTAHLHRGPLSRRLVLAGPADDFQTTELVRLMSELPGVSSAEWTHDTGVPLIAEGLAVAIIGFLFGLALAYLNELRRSHNAQWNW